MAKFNAAANPFNAEREAAAAEAAIQQVEKTTKKQSKEYYRFNARFDPELEEYLNEIAWLNRTSVTNYLNDLVKADMAAHPDWRQTVDILNQKK